MREGGKRGGLTDVSCYLQIPSVMGLYPGPLEKGGLELCPTRNQTRPEPEFKFFAKRRRSVSNGHLGLRPFDQIPASRTGGLEKRGRIGRVKERKEGSGERSIKSLIPYPVGALWPVVCVRRRPGTKGSQLRPLGLVHWQASWPLSTLNGQDVSCSEEESPSDSPLLQEGGLLPGLETGLSSNTRK